MAEKYSIGIDSSGYIFRRFNNRLDGGCHPAIELYHSGYSCWYSKGEIHREDGPSIIYSDGSKVWYSNGKLHREDGPAIEDGSGHKMWYLKGKELSEYEFSKWFRVRECNDAKFS